MKKKLNIFSFKTTNLLKVLLKTQWFLWILSVVSTIVCLVFELFQPVFFKYIVDNLSYQENDWFRNKFLLVVLLYALFLICNKLVIFIDSLFSIKLKQRITQTCRENVFENVISHALEFFTKKKIGVILERCSSDTSTLADFFVTQYKPVVRFVIIFIVAFWSMCSMNKIITLIAILFIPIFFLTNWLMFQRVLNVWRKQAKTFDMITSIMQENISNMALVRVCGKQSYEISRFDDALEQLKKVYRSSAFWCSVNFQTNWKLPEIQKMIILLVIISMATSPKYQITPGELLLYLSYSTLLLSAFGELGGIFGNISKMTVSLKRIQEIRNESPEYDTENYEIPSSVSMPIRMKNVTVNYDGVEVLKSIDLLVEKNEKIAIVGKVGSGKSSLAKLLVGMIGQNTWTGDIEYGGKSIREMNLNALRTKVVLVPQDSILFRKSIKDNLRIGNDDVSWERIEKVCRITESLDFILKFREGFDTLVGDRGKTLSGGQKQRLCLARALLRDFDVLILDDPLSAVDNKTAQIIWNNILNAYPDKCILIISNQIPIVQKTDRIIILENGHIESMGMHEELIKKNEFYRLIYKINMGEI